MQNRDFCLCGIFALVLNGCSTFGGAPPASTPVSNLSQTSVETAYIAPTLPPANTATLAPTKTQTPPPTPTPFSIAVVETQTPESGPSTAIPTADLDFGGWERYETFTGISFDTLINMDVQDYGRLIRIGDSNFRDDGIQLYVEFHIDHASSGYLPEGINASDPRSIIDGELREFKEDYTEIIMIRSVSNVIMNDYPGDDTALYTNSTDVPGTHEMTWYLAAVVHGDSVVRVYAQTPVNNAGTYLALAQRMIQTIEFPSEP